MMVGTNLNDVQLQQIVDKTIIEADLDKDGKISYEEFCFSASITSLIKRRAHTEQTQRPAIANRFLTLTKVCASQCIQVQREHKRTTLHGTKTLATIADQRRHLTHRRCRDTHT